jgi:hypothetical protein
VARFNQVVILTNAKLKIGKGGKKIELIGRNSLRRRRSPLNCSAIYEEEEEEEKEEEGDDDDLSKWIRANRVMQWCIFNWCYT